MASERQIIRLLLRGERLALLRAPALCALRGTDVRGVCGRGVDGGALVAVHASQSAAHGVVHGVAQVGVALGVFEVGARPFGVLAQESLAGGFEGSLAELGCERYLQLVRWWHIARHVVARLLLALYAGLPELVVGLGHEDAGGGVLAVLRQLDVVEGYWYAHPSHLWPLLVEIGKHFGSLEAK